MNARRPSSTSLPLLCRRNGAASPRRWCGCSSRWLGFAVRRRSSSTRSIRWPVNGAPLRSMRLRDVSRRSSWSRWTASLVKSRRLSSWRLRIGPGSSTRPFVVDWRSASNDFPAYFARDGVHLTKLGSQIYLDQIIVALGGEIPGAEEEEGDNEASN